MLSSNPSVQEIFQAHLFEEPLVPIGGEPTPAENAALATALLGYAKRSGPDDFSCLTSFLDAYPDCHWNAALLTDLGLEYYHTGRCSIRIHQMLPVTPAMAAGVSQKLWSLEDMVRVVDEHENGQ